ncbi:hypothetical protein AIR33_22735 [Salmonella enterica]|nr:hypothetical protein [Salmonella enterica]
MTPETRRRIHAFRNALVPVAVTRLNECFRMSRQELNEFLHDCSDQASTSQAQYQQNSESLHCSYV